jgi:hypothetical protein
MYNRSSAPSPAIDVMEKQKHEKAAPHLYELRSRDKIAKTQEDIPTSARCTPRQQFEISERSKSKKRQRSPTEKASQENTSTTSGVPQTSRLRATNAPNRNAFQGSYSETRTADSGKSSKRSRQETSTLSGKRVLTSAPACQMETETEYVELNTSGSQSSQGGKSAAAPQTSDVTSELSSSGTETLSLGSASISPANIEQAIDEATEELSSLDISRDFASFQQTTARGLSLGLAMAMAISTYPDDRLEDYYHQEVQSTKTQEYPLDMAEHIPGLFQGSYYPVAYLTTAVGFFIQNYGLRSVILGFGNFILFEEVAQKPKRIQIGRITTCLIHKRNSKGNGLRYAIILLKIS